VECHKNIDNFSVRVKVWHVDGPEGTIVYSHEFYFRDSEPCQRSDVPSSILARFDAFADDCYWDYVEDLEEDEIIGLEVKK
jgi:hypothetical protein